MASVEITDLRKTYGNVEVLHGINASIDDGEFVILVGPSGCGKSTLLRMIAGLETVSSGEIAIDGRRVNTLEPKDRDIAMVFQNYALYPQMTVAQNMGFSLELAGRSKREIRAEVSQAAEILSLTPLLNRKPAQLSGGQRQRVAMGRAIVRNPKVFLFDEPLSNLDAKLRVKMRAEIKALHQRLKATIVYVTHDQIEAMTMAEKIVVMKGGQVEQSGAPLALYDRPDNLFVATFMGSPAMNILPAEVVESGLRVADLAMMMMDPKLPVGTELKFGLRPDDIVIGGDNTVPAEVLVVEPTGAETLITARLGAHQIAISAKDRLQVKPGDQLPISLTSERAHLFDVEAGQRLPV
jgi:multiple sugar transport system ATP-binding protein